MNIVFRYINLLYGLFLTLGFVIGIPAIIAGGKKRWIIEAMCVTRTCSQIKLIPKELVMNGLGKSYIIVFK